MNRRTGQVVVYALTLALIVIFGALPYVFMVPVLFACCYGGWRYSAFASITFGVVSLCYAFMGSSVVALGFIAAPWIPIVTRFLAGMGAHGAYVLGSKIKLKSKAGKAVPYILGAATGTLLNTALVVSCLILFVSTDVALNGVTLYGYVPVMLISGAIELAVNIAIVPALSLAVKRALSPGRTNAVKNENTAPREIAKSDVKTDIKPDKNVLSSKISATEK